MKFKLSLLFLLVFIQLPGMQIEENTECEVIGGPNKGEKVIIQRSEETGTVLQKAIWPAESNYLCSLSYEIKTDDFSDGFNKAAIGDPSDLTAILKGHNYDGTVYYGEIKGLETCFHHSWLQEIKS